MFHTPSESGSETRTRIYDEEGPQFARFDKEATDKERTHHEVRHSHILSGEVDESKESSRHLSTRCPTAES